MKQRKKFIMLCGLMLAVSSPTYAENATEAVSVSDTASVVLTSDANVETEMQSVSESDTSETYAQTMISSLRCQQFGRKPIHILRIHRMLMRFQNKLKSLEHLIN